MDGSRGLLAGNGAFWGGVIAAGLGHASDVLLLQRPLGEPHGTGVAFLFLCGALSGGLVTLLAGRPLPIGAAVLVVVAGFGLYPLNAEWLGGVPWRSPVSLAADTTLMGVALCATALLWRWTGRGLPPLRSVGILGPLLAVAAFVHLVPRMETPAPDRHGGGPDILVLVLDSVRSDHVSFLGYSRETGEGFYPYLPAARVYENAYAASSWTFPSTRVLLGLPLSGDGHAIGPRLQSLGYATLMLSDNPHLSGRAPAYWGLDERLRSVGAWRLQFGGSLLGNIFDRIQPGHDRGLADRLGEWLTDRRGPVYVHAHLMNAHTPFRFPPIDKKERSKRRIEFPMTGMAIGEDQRQDIIARYDEGVRTSFRAARRMVEAMRARQRDLLVILTADHGELLGERGQWFHGAGLDEELLRVPLVVWGAGVKPGRVTGLAGHTSVPATVLAAALGTSSIDDLRVSDGVERVEGGLPGVAAFRRQGRHKVVLSATGVSLYELGTGGEVRAIAGSPMTDAFTRGLAIPGIFADTFEGLDPSVMERLRSLGYTSTSGGSVTPSPRPN